MGDRNNPIKFGPEWLRNLPRERSAARSAAAGQSASGGGGGGGGASGSGSSAGAAASPGPTPSSATNISHTNTSKVLLAKLRYGREEMLALYDRNSEAPSELKFIDTLYQPRGKQPLALNYSFEDDMRDSMRSAPPIGGISSRDSFGMGRGSVRGITMEGRGRSRGFVRQTSAGRGTSWHAGTPRLPSYSGGPDDEGGSSRSWNSPLAGRSGGDQPDWSNNKMFRNKRQGTGSTNWRQQSRDDGDEWRSSEAGRSRPLDKWDRDWGERPSGDKSQSWNSNRRTWVGGETHNHEENLPEWAAENADCSGGTFDSSGAFHGYSNDDTNLPKHQDSSFALTRSHTHGSFARSKTVEEGSDEWWASEKAKKLSPKRFDASDIKFKKQSNTTAEASGSGPGKEHHNKLSISKEEQPQEVQEKAEAQAAAPEQLENTDQQQNDDKFSSKNVYAPKFGESKKFDAMMRNDINMEEASDERGNFQSVIITPNNSLRQKHQHLVPANEGKPLTSARQGANASNSEMEHASHTSPEDLVNNMFGMTVEDKEVISAPSPNSRMGIPSPGMAMGSANNSLGQNHSPNLNMSMANPGLQMDPNKQGMPTGMHQATAMSAGLLQQGIPAKSSSGIQAAMSTGMQQVGLQNPGLQAAGIQNPALQAAGLQNSGMQGAGLQNPTRQGGGLQNTGLQGGGMQPGLSNLRGQTPGMQSVMQPVGITNSALNASLGLPIVPGGNMALPMTNVPPPVYPNVCMANNMSGALGAASLQAGNMAGFQSGLPGINNANVGSNSLFLGQNANNPSMSSSSDIPMPNHGGQNNMFPMHGMPHAGSPGGFGNSIYSNNGPNLAEQWYYEDPKRNIQGPFSSKDMYNWYRAGFFTPSLMVRRACETIMRPLGSYGPGVPFAPVEMMGAFPISGAFDSRSQTNRDPMLNSQGSLGLDVDLLWGQPSNDLMWMQQPMGSRNDTRVNNLSMFFWDQQPSAIASNSLLSEDITKEMKTEDQILAQLRASQSLPQPPTLPFGEQPPAAAPPAANPEEAYQQGATPTPNLEELHKLIQKDALADNAAIPAPLTAPTATPAPGPADNEPIEPQVEKPLGPESTKDEAITKVQTQSKPAEAKPAKQAKADVDKATKNKENNNTKAKNKKSKDEKKEDLGDIKVKDEDALKGEKRSQESSPSKTKKEDKSSKKELEREKKEWIKEGFTIVKGAEKTITKDIKKRAEEARAAEDAERRRKENEKLAAEEEKRKKQAEILRKQQEQQQQRQAESVAKKAPWSSAAGASAQAPSRDLPTLAEIQRLEREKKLEQMKEQQHMMQLIAQQQAAALAREQYFQEVQANLGWAKKKGSNANAPGQSLAEIQAEARKQAAAATQAAAQAAHLQAIEEAQAASAVTTTNHVPWASTHNGVAGGFWDTQLNQPSQPEKPQEPAKTPEVKTKKKVTLVIPKKETSPAVEFESWCTGFLAPWNSKIDAPTFVGFLKDIESPYEVKDYVKCYLGDSKESNDFARQFLERRSKLLRVGMVTPSDDLCSPAMAINPRTPLSEYQEIKSKGKKTKKNKMLKVDARILGFSVTASEDRINVGDIDTV